MSHESLNSRGQGDSDMKMTGMLGEVGEGEPHIKITGVPFRGQNLYIGTAWRLKSKMTTGGGGGKGEGESHIKITGVPFRGQNLYIGTALRVLKSEMIMVRIIAIPFRVLLLDRNSPPPPIIFTLACHESLAPTLNIPHSFQFKHRPRSTTPGARHWSWAPTTKELTSTLDTTTEDWIKRQ